MEIDVNKLSRLLKCNELLGPVHAERAIEARYDVGEKTRENHKS
jgi:hypothetical protein